jgi:hypothetical protein
MRVRKHLHLLGRGVLRLIEYHERLVERASAHEGEGSDLDRAAFEELRDLVVAHEVVERVVERAQVRVHLRRHVAGEKPEPFACLHGRAHQHDALHGFALERVHRACDSEVGLSRCRRVRC